MTLNCSLQAELFTLLEHEHLQDAAILIMANKQDLKDAMNVKEMTDVLSLHSLKRHDWHIQVIASFSSCLLLCTTFRVCCKQCCCCLVEMTSKTGRAPADKLSSGCMPWCACSMPVLTFPFIHMLNAACRPPAPRQARG